MHTNSYIVVPFAAHVKRESLGFFPTVIEAAADPAYRLVTMLDSELGDNDPDFRAVE